MKFTKKKSSSFKRRSTQRSGTSWLTKYKPGPLAIVPRAPGLGRSLRTRLETSFYANVTSNASGVYTAQLNVGSCFDPTGSLAAIQPVTFDQLKLIYARYLVTGGFVVVECCQPTSPAGALQPWVVCIYPSTTSTPVATYQGAASQPQSVEKILPSDGSSIQLYKSWNAQQIIGSRLPPVAEDAGALISADPAVGQNCIMHIFAQYATAQTIGFTLRIKIVQDVIFDQRIAVVDV
jgi:hypothetical protein